jgi:hypothetical protein
MIKNKLIIIPLEEPWDHSADFLRQTALTLSKQNLVYIYDQKQHYFFPKKNRVQIYPAHKNIIFHQVKYWLPFERFSFIDKINRHLSFKLFLLRHRQKNKIIWIFHPNYYDLPKLKDKKSISIYDCVDYNENHKKEQMLINNVDYFFVNSLALKKLHSNHQNKKNPIYLSVQGFFQPDDKKIKKIRIKREKKKAIIGYVGGINCRLDYKLLNHLIKNHPEWLFVFYGPEQKNPKLDKKYQTQNWIKQLKKHDNTLFGCSDNRNIVYGLIKNFDIAIIPYNLDLPFNKYCYPMKIFEYFYLGKPVISSGILELKLKKFNKFIKIADNFEEWEAAIKQLIGKSLSIEQEKKLRQLAIDNSWQNKIDKISKYLEK